MNKIQVHPQIEEIKKIWEQHKNQFSVRHIFKTYLKDYFQVPEDGKTKGNPEFMRFISMVRDWRKQEERIQAKLTAENLSDEEIEAIAETNAKELTVLLQDIITAYRKNPERFKQLSFSDISKLYQIIEKIQHDQARLELQKKKLKSDENERYRLQRFERRTTAEIVESWNLMKKSFEREIERRIEAGLEREFYFDQSGNLILEEPKKLNEPKKAS